MSEFRWDVATGRYRVANSGRFISAQQVRDAIDALADGASRDLVVITQRLQAGSITLAEWQQSMMATIKSAHVATGIIAKGGRAEVAPADWGLIGRRVRDEYAFARQFAEDIASGKQPLDGRLVARAKAYGQASRSTFSAVYARDQKNRGLRFERNILGGSEACVGCRAESSRGVVPIGSLTPIGSRSPCSVNCRCRISYMRDEVAA